MSRTTQRRTLAAGAALLAVLAFFVWNQPPAAEPKAQHHVIGAKIGTAVQVTPDGTLVELGGTTAPAAAALVVAAGSLAFAATKPKHPNVQAWELERAELCDRYEQQLACLREQVEFAVTANHLLWSMLDEEVLP